MQVANPNRAQFTKCASYAIPYTTEASNAHKTSHSAFLNSKKRPAEQLIVKALITLEKHNIDLMKKLFTTAFFAAKNEKPYTDFVIAFHQFITNDCTTPV